MVSVPIEFQPAMPYRYPADNVNEFERWYFENYTNPDVEEETRVYLPIFWTAYYVRNNITRSTIDHTGFFTGHHAFDQLQLWIDANLVPGVRYYTIVQHDDGILHDLSHLDVKVFGMGGGKFDFPLPLISEPHQWSFPDSKRTILASFVGQMTHPCREQIYSQYKTDKDIFVSKQKLPLHEYCDVMSRSIFALCPRGYGPTSFRIQEAIQYGAIPVYISDEFIEPYNIGFENYGLKFHIDYSSSYNMKDILMNEKSKELVLPDIKQLFTYQGCKDAIVTWI